MITSFVNCFIATSVPTAANVKLIGYQYDDWASANAQRVIDLSQMNLQENDVVVAMLYIAQPAGNDDLQPVTSGYTEQCERYDSATTDASFGIYTKVMGATPDSDITIQATPVSSGNNRWWGARITVWRNVDETTPMDVAVVHDGGTDTSSPTSPAITPVTADAVVLDFFCSTNGNVLNLTSHANPGSYAPFHSRKIFKEIVSFAAKRWTGGTYGPWAHGGGSSLVGAREAAQVALRPKLVPIEVISDLTFGSAFIHWWDVEYGMSLYNDGTSVVSWIDRVDWRRIMLPAGGTFPTYSATAFGGAKPGIQALSDAGMYSGCFLSGDNTWTAVCVTRMQNAGSAWGRMLSLGNPSAGSDESGNERVTLVRNNTTTNTQIFRAGSGSATFNAGYTNPHIHEICLDGSSTKYFVDGVQRGSLANTNNLNVNQIGIFREASGSGFEDGRGVFGDVMILNRALTAGERTELNNYLTNKFI